MSTLRFTRALATAGRRSWLLCQDGSPLARAALADGLDRLTLTARDYVSPAATRRLRAWIRAERPVVLHAHRSTDLWLLRQAARGLAAPPALVLTSRIFFRRQLKRGLLHRWLYAGVARVVALSDTARAHLIECLPLPPERVVVIPNGVDLERFATGAQRAAQRAAVRAALAAAPGIDPAVPLVGIVGRLDPKKGQDDAIRALAALPPPLDRCALVLIGDETAGEPGETRRLRALARDVGVGARVHFLGHREDVPALLAALDLFLLPSHGENFGNVLLEAMAAGVPIIGTRAGGTPEILDHGAAGELVVPRDVAALAATMQTLLADPSRRARLAAAGRARVERHYAFPRIVERTRALYDEVAPGT
jgi:glycosyltransferase involved in cell wall biosynthesis